MNWVTLPRVSKVCLTVDGNRLPYSSDAGSLAASLLEAKLLFHSTILDVDKGACFMATDLKDFFLVTTMEESEYMRIHSRYFLMTFVKNDIDSKIAPHSFVYVWINKGMYGLKQATVLAYNLLAHNLKQDGYTPCPSTTG